MRRARTIGILLGLAVGFGVVRWALIVPLGPDAPALATRVAPPPVKADIEIVPLRLGASTAPRCAPAGAASCLRTTEIIHAAFLVKHPRATFLIDAGVSARAQEDLARFPFWVRQAFAFHSEGALGTALAAIRAKPEFVLLTHAHWDHASGLRDLDHPRVVVGPGEREFIRDFPKDAIPSVQPEHFADARLETFAWDGPAYETFPKSHDLFGDGSVVLVPLTGHTPGSLGVFVNGVHGRRVFFIGDAGWSRDAVDLPSHKLRPMASLADDDRAGTSDTLWRLHHLHEAEPELLIVPTHDGAAVAELRALAGR